MAKFLSPLEVRCLKDGKRWMLLTELRFVTDDGQIIYVPRGFITERHRRAAILRDWIYRTPGVAISKEDADAFFLQGMIADDSSSYVSRITARK